MESLGANGQGLYALECHLTLAYLKIKSGKDPEELTAALREFEKAEQQRGAAFLEDDLYDDWIGSRRRELEEQFESLSEHLPGARPSRGSRGEVSALLSQDHPSEKIYAKLCRWMVEDASCDR